MNKSNYVKHTVKVGHNFNLERKLIGMEIHTQQMYRHSLNKKNYFSRNEVAKLLCYLALKQAQKAHKISVLWN